ncbi:unnamed protein product [Moneuplotes crassus]|uniref:Uncharacterized protein n=1 Tax=Euplotes crassus TaxID=5936 RepID=A0AAD1UD40_EUPCR|nr:unnamed protein product [Moneuplotes crassus]
MYPINKCSTPASKICGVSCRVGSLNCLLSNAKIPDIIAIHINLIHQLNDLLDPNSFIKVPAT